MNYENLELIIENYKQLAPSITNGELYKWKTIKTFEDHWDIEAENFHGMIKQALSGTFNLLGDGRYYARKMIGRFAEENPEKVRLMFGDLYNENTPLTQRIEKFMTESDELVKRISEKDKKKLIAHQDMRAVYAYLTLKYPEKYFFYKHKMFLEFGTQIEFKNLPISGRLKNLEYFQSMAEDIREEIKKDNELINWHKSRLGSDCYQDPNLNLLTQDLMWLAVSKKTQSPDFSDSSSIIPGSLEFIEGEIESVIKKSEPNFKGKKINHPAKNKQNAALGNLGELLVLQWEQNYLRENGRPDLADKVDHVAVTKGDGCGYDVHSYTLEDQDKLIEVKTTRYGAQTPLYLTAQEIKRSSVDADKFHLYRLFYYNYNNNTAKAIAISGDLEKLLELESKVYTASLRFKQHP